MVCYAGRTVFGSCSCLSPVPLVPMRFWFAPRSLPLLILAASITGAGCQRDASPVNRDSRGEALQDDSTTAEEAQARPQGENVAVGETQLGAAPAADAAPETAEEFLAAGIASEEAGRSSEAISNYTRAIELDPTSDVVRRRLGSLLIRLERFVDASIFFGQIAEREPDNPDAHNDWGAVLVQIGSVSEAIDQFREALRLDADHPDAHYNLATALLSEGRVEECKQHLVETLRIAPSYLDANFTLGRAYLIEGELDKAVAQFQHVMRANREYKSLDQHLGRAYSRQGNLRKAVQHYSEAVRRAPFNYEARYALGVALSMFGNPAAARAQFTEALRLSPESHEAHHELAQVLVELGKQEEAITHYNAALALRPDWPEALNNQAWLLATTLDERLRDPARAVELAERAKQIADHNMPRVLDTLAAAQAAAGEPQQAAETAGEAARWADETNQAEVAEEIRARAEQYQDGA